MRTMQRWIKERDEVALSYDVEKFKAFFRKWQLLGVYSKGMKLPADNVIEITMRKMVYHMAKSTQEQKKEAEKWLIEHGSSTSLD